MTHAGTRANVRRAAAVAAGKISAQASRMLGRGGGTALPGLVATAVHPDLVRDLARQLPRGSVVVSGTNGKTTTSRILGTIASLAGLDPLRNNSGSNLLRGLASSLVQSANIFGNIHSTAPRLGLFEVDEAALPAVLPQVRPNIVLLLNLFRDQLDRYGEVATIARLWTEALRTVGDGAHIIANCDDPLIANVVNATPDVVLFGVESGSDMAREAEHASDVKACPKCGAPIEYDKRFLGHLGHYRCTACDFKRPVPDIAVHNVKLHGVSGSSFTLDVRGQLVDVEFPLPGMYNVYNATAASAAAARLGVDLDVISAGLEAVTPAFGRMEQMAVHDRTLILCLAKNPTGLNEVLRAILTEQGRLHLVVMLNDNVADGRDVSWIWDADVEMLNRRVETVVFAGTRAEDMALRFKYAGIIGPDGDARWSLEHIADDAVQAGLRNVPVGGRCFVIPTYTAMLEARHSLTRRGYVRPYWEE